ncbi:NACHT, LRR and PYD domains-containing protein 3-like protein, partial [Lates japonicus]
MKSDESKDIPLLFKQSVDRRIQQQRPDSPEPSCLSLKSDDSKKWIIEFKGRRPSADQIVDQESSEVPSGQSAQQHQTHLDSIFMLLEENIVTFVKNELKKMQKVLSPDYPECLESQREDEEVLDGEDEEQRRSSREEFLKIKVDPDRSSSSPSGAQHHWFHTLQARRLRVHRGRSNSDPLGGKSSDDHFTW